MSLRKHRIAAVSIVLTEIVALFVIAPALTADSDQVRAVRDELKGSWVATSIQVGATRKIEGAAAQTCRAEFDGKSVVFHHLVDDIDARGTYLLDLSKNPNQMDFKLDVGWNLGIFELKGDTLTLSFNYFTLPERLGVPNTPRPRRLPPAEDQQYYVFKRAKSGS